MAVSFYEGRRGLRDYGDVNEAPAKQPQGVTGADTSQDGEAWGRHRRARPAEVLLPVAIKRLRALPTHLRPLALAAQFPRVANLIALHWEDEGACRAYFDSLLIDQRGGRQGFPAAVRADLANLRDHWYRERAK
jgi:hypothetical protein